jgi:hypothetical protein
MGQKIVIDTHTLETVASRLRVQQWALATIAQYDLVTNAANTTSGLGTLSGLNRLQMQQALRDSWQVMSRSQYEERITQVRAKPSLTAFQTLVERLRANPSLAPRENRDPRQVQFCLTLTPEHAARAMLAWDLCRLILLCRTGFQAGMASEEQSWDEIIPASREIQRGFAGWADLGAHYLDARFCHFPQSTDVKAFRRATKTLLDRNNRSSPWIVLEWDLVA